MWVAHNVFAGCVFENPDLKDLNHSFFNLGFCGNLAHYTQ